MLARLLAGREPSVKLVQNSRECTPPYLFTEISKSVQGQQSSIHIYNLLDPPTQVEREGGKRRDIQGAHLTCKHESE